MNTRSIFDVELAQAAGGLTVQGVLHLPTNPSGRDFVVGDIQGAFEQLEELLEAVQFDPSHDRLLSVGDLVDRGPSSYKVLKLAQQSPWFIPVLGNHEVIAARCLLGLEDAYPLSEQAWTADVPSSERKAAAHYLLTRPIALDVTIGDMRVGIVHAEVPMGLTWADVENRYAENAFIESLLWGRRRIHKLTRLVRAEHLPAQISPDSMPPSVEGVAWVVAGHTTIRLNDFMPLRVPGHLWIDTGAGYKDGRLSFIDMASGQFIQTRTGQKPRVSPIPAARAVSELF